MIEHVQSAGALEHGVDHARAGVHRPGRAEAVAADAQRRGAGKDRHQAVEVVARHLVQRGLVEIGQVEGPVPRLGVEQGHALRRSQLAGGDAALHGAVVAVVAHLLPHGEGASGGLGMLHQAHRVGKAVGDRLGHEYVQPRREAAATLLVVQLRRRMDEGGIGVEGAQRGVQLGEQSAIGHAQQSLPLLQGVLPHVDDARDGGPRPPRQGRHHDPRDAAHADGDTAPLRGAHHSASSSGKPSITLRLPPSEIGSAPR